MFDRWRYPAALAVVVGIVFPAFAAAMPGNGEAPAKGPSDGGIQAGPEKPRKRHVRKHRRRFARLPGGVSRSMLDAIGECESGGNPHAVAAGGTYRGKYQFDYGTWSSVGGHGDPAAASEREQDYRAALLYLRAGSSPWPNCA